MTLLVTGAAGQIGSKLFKKLLNEGYEVIPITHDICDIKDYKELESIFMGSSISTVIHLASHLPNTKNPDYFGVNIGGTRNIINLSEKYGVEKIVFASSMRVYSTPPEYLPVKETHPLNPKELYGISKLNSELIIHLSKLKYVIIRYGGVYGNGNFGVIHNFLTSERITIQGDGKQSTDFIHVDDAVIGTLMLLNCEGIYNVSSGEETYIAQLAQYCSWLTGAKIVKSGTETDRPFRFFSDVTKIKKLGLKPKLLRQGLEEYWRVLNDNR